MNLRCQSTYMPFPQIAVTREPTEEHTIVKLIGIGVCGRQALKQLAEHRIPYVETMACDELDDDVRAFMVKAHLLFLVFDPDEANELNVAVGISKLGADMPNLVTIAVSVLPTAWQAQWGARLTLPTEEPGKYLLLVVVGLSAILRQEGYVGVDFMDVRHILSQPGCCTFGVGIAQGADRGQSAAHLALQQIAASGSRIGDMAGGIVILSSAMGSLKLVESKTTMNFIRSQTDPSWLLIYGNNYDEALSDEVRVTVIASYTSGSSIVSC